MVGGCVKREECGCRVKEYRVGGIVRFSERNIREEPDGLNKGVCRAGISTILSQEKNMVSTHSLDLFDTFQMFFSIHLIVQQ